MSVSCWTHVVRGRVVWTSSMATGDYLFLILLLLLVFFSSGSPERLRISFYHFVLPSKSSSSNLTLSISLLHESFHLVFCLPLRLFPGTVASDILLSSCPLSILDYPFRTLEMIGFMRASSLSFPLYCCCIGEAGYLSHHSMATVVTFFCRSLLLAFSLHFLLPLPCLFLSSHNPPILAVVFLDLCNPLVLLSQVLSVIFHI